MKNIGGLTKCQLRGANISRYVAPFGHIVSWVSWQRNVAIDSVSSRRFHVGTLLELMSA